MQQFKYVGHFIVSANSSEKTNLWKQQRKYEAQSKAANPSPTAGGAVVGRGGSAGRASWCGRRARGGALGGRMLPYTHGGFIFKPTYCIFLLRGERT